MASRPISFVLGVIFLLCSGYCSADGPAGTIQAQKIQQFQGITVYQGVTYTQSGTPELMDIATPAQGGVLLPAVVCIHGGGWSAGSRGDMDGMMMGFAQNGYAACSIDYRLAPNSPFPAQIQDCKCAVRYMKAHASALHIDPSRICAYGSSAGGHLALLLGLTSNVTAFEGTGGWNDQSSSVKCVLDWFGPTELNLNVDPSTIPKSSLDMVEGLIGGDFLTHRQVAIDASPMTYVKQGDPPILIVQGDADKTVPEAQSVDLYNRLKAVGDDATLDIVQGAGHGPDSAFLTPQHIAVIRAFLTRVL